MIVKLLSKHFTFNWVVLHVLLGIAATFSNLFIIGWFYITLLSSFYLISFVRVDKAVIVASTMVYIGAFELLARMTKCSPIIPWEASKYLFTLLSLLGIFFTLDKKNTNKIGWLIILLIIPSILIDKSGVVDTGDIIFNVMGLVNIGLGLIFFSSLTIKKERFFDIIRTVIYPCLTILVFTIIKTPDFDELSFSLGAQESTSGDFGSNQVSTVLGLGFLLMSFSWLLNWKVLKSRMADGVVATLFLMQGLFTFSRGGVIGGGVALLVFLYYIFLKSGRKFRIPPNIKRFAIPALVVFTLAILYANHITGGKLLLRYQGETHGTVMGTRDRDLTTITSNRNLIFLSDLELWSEYPMLGSGAGTSKYMRSEGQGLAAHVEFSRLLAEHGVLGLIIFMLILSSGFRYFNEKELLIKAIKLSLFALAIFTTFHSATRTFITPLLLSVCAINILPSNKKYDTLPGK